MSAAFVSEAGVNVYEEIRAYVARETGMPSELVTGLGYRTINDMLEGGSLDAAFVCGLPYVVAHDVANPPIELLAAPVMKAARYGQAPKYFSDLIVRADSPIRSIHDLAGKTYVFNEELSNSGYNMPRFRLIELGLTNGFFGRVLRSGSHEESIRMVASGQADASFVDSLVLDYDREKHVGEAARVRVLESVGPAGIPPLVVSRALPSDTRSLLRRVLLTMHDDPEGRAILDRALVEKFVAVDDRNYDDVRAMQARAKAVGFTVLR